MYENPHKTPVGRIILRALNQGQGQGQGQGQAEQGQADQGQADLGLPEEGAPEQGSSIMVLHKHMLCELHVFTCCSCFATQDAVRSCSFKMTTLITRCLLYSNGA